jgi:hypothetical protein
MKFSYAMLIFLTLYLTPACSFGSSSSPDSGAASRPTVMVQAQPTPTEIKPIQSQSTASPELDTPVIAYNQIKEGQLTEPAEIDEWVFNAQAGERVNIVLNSQFDSYMELYGPDGDFISSNDDHGGTLNAALFDLQLRQDGPHKVVVRGYDGTTGGYVLALTGGHPTIGGGTLSNGDSRSVLLTEQGYKWQFQGQAGHFLTVTTDASERVDSYLSIFGPDGARLAYDDDSGGRLNAEIFEFELPLDGTYTIRARTVSDSGTVTLNVNSAEQASGGGPLTLGTRQVGTLKPGRTHRWHFAGEAGQTINLSMNSSDFDTFLELRNAQDVILAENDDSQGGTDSSIDLFTLASDDTYTVVARGIAETEGGDYEILLKTVKVTTGGGSLTPDLPTQALLAPDLTDRWVFDAEADTFVTVTLESDSLDTFLELYGPDETLLTTDDDSGGGLNAALIEFPLTAAGAYQVAVQSAREDRNDSGVYEILLTLTENPEATGELVTDQPRQSKISAGEQHTWTFEAEEDSIVTVRMESSTIDTYLAVYDSSGELLILDDDTDGTNAVIDDFIVPQAGEYRIIARAYSAEQEGDYTISLEIVE